MSVQKRKATHPSNRQTLASLNMWPTLDFNQPSRSAPSYVSEGWGSSPSECAQFRGKFRTRNRPLACCVQQRSTAVGTSAAAYVRSPSPCASWSSQSASLSASLVAFRIEGTAPVTSVAPGRQEGSVLACYGDDTIREWELGGSRPVPRKLLDGLRRPAIRRLGTLR
jgi:hypothetical protein